MNTGKAHRHLIKPGDSVNSTHSGRVLKLLFNALSKLSAGAEITCSILAPKEMGKYQMPQLRYLKNRALGGT